MHRTLMVLLFSFLAVAVLDAVAPCHAEDGTRVQVTASRLNVREGPGTVHPVVGSVAQGEILSRLEAQPGWVRVRTEGGLVGWVSADYVAEYTMPDELGDAPPPEAPEATVAPILDRDSGPKHGGSLTGKLLKWGSLAGAGIAGALAYSEHSAGNDSYDEYKSLVHTGDPAAADVKFKEAEDHDGKAVTYLIASGVLAGAFVVQQFLIGDDPVQLAWNPARGEARAGLVIRRF